jgi:hypothetical protein
MMVMLRNYRRSLVTRASLLPALAAVLPAGAAAQKPALDHDAYDVWKTIEAERISPDGEWVHLAPRVGDSELVVSRRGEHEVPGGPARYCDPATGYDRRSQAARAGRRAASGGAGGGASTGSAARRAGARRRVVPGPGFYKQLAATDSISTSRRSLTGP